MVKYRVVDVKLDKTKYFNSEKSALEYYHKNCRRQDLFVEQNYKGLWCEVIL